MGEAPWRPRTFVDVARDAGLSFVHEAWHEDGVGRGWGMRTLDLAGVTALWGGKEADAARWWRVGTPHRWHRRACGNRLRPGNLAALDRALEAARTAGEAWDLGGDPTGRERHWGFADRVVVMVEDEGEWCLWPRGPAPRGREAMAAEEALTRAGHGDPFVGPGGPPAIAWRDRSGTDAAGVLGDLASLLARHRGLPRALDLRLTTRTPWWDLEDAPAGVGASGGGMDVVSGEGEKGKGRVYVAEVGSPVGVLLDACAARIGAEGRTCRRNEGGPWWRSSGWRPVPLTMVARIAPDTTSATMRAAARGRQAARREAACERLAAWLGEDAEALRTVMVEAGGSARYDERDDLLGMVLDEDLGW